jgi:hypothetical protein
MELRAALNIFVRIVARELAFACTSFKNNRVSVRARAKLSCLTESLTGLQASSMAIRIRQQTIMCAALLHWVGPSDHTGTLPVKAMAGKIGHLLVLNRAFRARNCGSKVTGFCIVPVAQPLPSPPTASEG